MSVLEDVFRGDSAADYLDIFTSFNDARVEMIADSDTFCQFESGDEFYLEQIINTNFPYIIPVDYTSWPMSKKILRVENYYYRILDHVRNQVGEAKAVCYQRGLSPSPVFYQVKSTVQHGVVRVRSDL